jgi:hypothetical protein
MLYKIGASVGAAGKNQRKDVAVTQFLLNCVPPSRGGANPELVKDGICGPKTIGAIKAFQQQAFGTVDSLIEPGKRTITALNQRMPVISGATRYCSCNQYRSPPPTAMLSFAVPIVLASLVQPGLETPGSKDPANRAEVYFSVEELKPQVPLEPRSPREQAMAMVPGAVNWIGHAMRILRGLIETGGDARKITAQPGFGVLRRHFHISTADLKQPGFFNLSAPNTLLRDLENTYNWMMFVLQKAVHEPVFINVPAEGDNANDTAFVPALGQRDGRIRFTPLFLNLGHLHQTLTLVHEASHLVSNVIRDHTYRREDPDEYDGMPMASAITNADTYAYFAFNCASGSDRILQNKD